MYIYLKIINHLTFVSYYLFFFLKDLNEKIKKN